MNELTITEKNELENCEEIIRKNINGFRETGEALMSIRDKRLYRDRYETFENYCQEKWSFDKRYANRLIDSSKFVQKLGSMDPKPKNERQVRPLSKLKDDPEKQVEAWKEAVETAPDGKVTARHVEEVVRKRSETVSSKTTEPKYILELRSIIAKLVRMHAPSSSVTFSYLDSKAEVKKLSELFEAHFQKGK